MVNTVGSYENKYWSKKWILIKKKLTLSSRQKSLIIGSLLGDGTMRIGKGAVNANFKVEHGLQQKDYVYWKYQILKPFVFTKPKISYRTNENGERYAKSWWFRTIRHPMFTQIYREFYEGEGYRNGRKIIPPKIEKELNPFVLAVWIMDDGSYSRNKIDISTYCFSLEEIHRLQTSIKKITGIKVSYYRDRDKGWRIYFNREPTKELIKIIRPYIIPSMMYKIGLGFRNPVTTGFSLPV